MKRYNILCIFLFLPVLVLWANQKCKFDFEEQINDSLFVKIDTLVVLNGRCGEGAFVKLKRDRLAYIYTQFVKGNTHDDSKSYIYYVVSKNKNRTRWSKPKLLVKNHGKQNIMSVSCLRKNDTILVQYLEKNSITDLKVVHRYFNDKLKPLQYEEYLNLKEGYNVVNNDRIILDNNQVLIPISEHKNKLDKFNPKGIPMLEFVAWGSGKITRETIIFDTIPNLILQEPGIVSIGNDSLMFWLRSDNDNLLFATAYKGNYEFSDFKEQKSIKNVHRSPISIRNFNNDLVIAYNKKTKNNYLRNPLCVALSKDNLRTY